MGGLYVCCYQGNTALHLAARHGHDAAVRALLLSSKSWSSVMHALDQSEHCMMMVNFAYTCKLSQGASG